MPDKWVQLDPAAVEAIITEVKAEVAMLEETIEQDLEIIKETIGDQVITKEMIEDLEIIKEMIEDLKIIKEMITGNQEDKNMQEKLFHFSLLASIRKSLKLP